MAIHLGFYRLYVPVGQLSNIRTDRVHMASNEYDLDTICLSSHSLSWSPNFMRVLYACAWESECNLCTNWLTDACEDASLNTELCTARRSEINLLYNHKNKNSRKVFTLKKKKKKKKLFGVCSNNIKSFDFYHKMSIKSWGIKCLFHFELEINLEVLSVLPAVCVGVMSRLERYLLSCWAQWKANLKKKNMRSEAVTRSCDAHCRYSSGTSTLF